MSEIPERVLLLTGEIAFRGASILSLRLARGLQDRGIDTVLLCTRVGHIDRSLLSRLKLHEMPGYAAPIWGRVVRQTVLHNLEEQPPDVIHVMTPQMLFQGLWLGNRLQCPVILHVCDHSEAGRVSLPSGGSPCQAIICVSDSVQDALPRLRQIDQVEKCIIHPGVPVPATDQTAILEPDRVPVIGMAGPLELLKGGSFFLRACHRVIADDREMRMVIAGSGPEERNLRRLATSLELDDYVTFVDDSTDMQTLLSALDIFCLPSLQQGIGVVLLEAMALGRPVIASSVGGIRSVLEDETGGITVPASDSRRLADAILQLLDNPEDARRMASRGRDMVAQRFGLDRMLDETIALYSDLIGAPATTVPMPLTGTASTRETP